MSVRKAILSTGGISVVARHMRVPVSTVWEWSRKDRLPPYRVDAFDQAIAALTAEKAAQ